MMMDHLLAVLIWLPIIGGFAVLGLGERAAVARWVSLGIACLTLVLSIPLWLGFDTGTAAMQFVERVSWLPAIHSDFFIGVDGISMPLIVLTTFTTVLIVISSWQNVAKRVSQFFAAFLILEGLMIGVFAALDGVLFYVFWEAMLLPMFIIIGIWGGPRRVYATIKFFLYTFIGSLLMLVALIYMYLKAGSYELAVLQRLPLTLTEQTFIFLAFFAAFAVKVPMWPVHTWLPDAHVEAPTGGSVVLAAIMLKMGGYGFLRFSLPIAPDACRELDWLIIALSLTAVVYIGFVALVQRDMKKLIAYSSIAHMGFVTLGAFIGFRIVAHSGKTSGIAMGLDGAVVQMLSHGLVSAAMFLCVGVMYDRVHSREISAYGGVINTMPKFAAFMVLFAMANAGLPGTSGFVGEFLVILASFKANAWFAFLAATTLVLGAAYTLWLVKRVIFGEIANDKVAALKDLNEREFFVLGVLAAAVLLVGLWPAPVLDVMRASTHHLAQQLLVSKIPPRSPFMNAFNVTDFNSGLGLAAPEIFLGLAACVILMADLFVSDRQRHWIGVLSVFTLLVCAALTVMQPVSARVVGLGGMFELDPMAQVLKLVTLLTVAVVFVYSTDYLKRRAILKGEYYVLGLFATLGGLVLISAASLVTLYLGLELMSLCLYAMVAFDRESGIAAESAIKYFVLGSMASGTLLYGMSIVYGVTGSLELAEIAMAVHNGFSDNIGLLFGMAFLIVGIGFKLGAVPFHMWIPDVYEGSPTCVTVFIGTASKLAAFALAMRLLPEALAGSQADWSQMLIVMSVLSIAIGNIVAVAQSNLKRMLAYSTISHIGYILLGILSGTAQGYQAAMFYMISYVIVASGAFGMILLLARQGFEADKLVDFKGLNARSPWFAGMMAILMFSLAGLPPFIGFWAKLGVVQAVLDVNYIWLAVVAVLFSVVGAFYYLRIVKLMYFDDPIDTTMLGGSTLMRTVLSANALLVFGLGVAPAALIAVCQKALQ